MSGPIDSLGHPTTILSHTSICQFRKPFNDLVRQHSFALAAISSHVLVAVTGSSGIQALGMSTAEAAMNELLCAAFGG